MSPISRPVRLLVLKAIQDGDANCVLAALDSNSVPMPSCEQLAQPNLPLQAPACPVHPAGTAEAPTRLQGRNASAADPSDGMT